eukprot:5879719-Pyramimonas_sp.AAC.1
MCAQDGPRAPQESPWRSPRRGTRTDRSGPPPQTDLRYHHEAPKNHPKSSQVKNQGRKNTQAPRQIY